MPYPLRSLHSNTSNDLPQAPFKIFGERNTGTNLLRVLIEKNELGTCLPSTINQICPRSHRILTKILAPRFYERFIDVCFSGQPPTKAWKHSATNLDRLEAFRDVRVLFLVRHPLSWSLSMERRPYHLYASKNSAKENFLETPFRLLGRENMGKGYLTLVERWNRKTLNYVAASDALNSKGIATAFLRFEDLVLSQEDVLRDLHPLFRKEPAGDLKIVLNSTKPGGLSVAGIQRREFGTDWRRIAIEKYGIRACRSFNSALLERFGYVLKP